MAVSRGPVGAMCAVSLDQLVALNDEMAALVRAGCLWSRGWSIWAATCPGDLVSSRPVLASGCAGESLPQILAREGKQFPPVWCAVVEAGVRSGRLSAALEGLSTTARRVAEVRRAVGIAWIYPLVVVSLAFVLFLFLVTRLAPLMLAVFRDLTSRTDPFLETLVWVGDGAAVWGVAVPLCLVAGCSLAWYRSGRAARLQGHSHAAPRQGGWFGRWPSVRQTLWDGRVATFAELMALLVDQRIPLQEAMVLAGEASGDKGLSESSRAIAVRLASGEVFAEREQIPAPFPPLLGWLLGHRAPADPSERVAAIAGGDLSSAGGRRGELERDLLADRADGGGGRNGRAPAGSRDVRADLPVAVRIGVVHCDVQILLHRDGDGWP